MKKILILPVYTYTQEHPYETRCNAGASGGLWLFFNRVE